MAEKKKISVFCIWRDSEKYIERTLRQLEDIEDRFSKGVEFSYFFYENDSTDKTPDILEKWTSLRSGLFLSEKINAKKFGSTPCNERMKFLCECRNKSKILASSNQSDYSLLFDSDVEFSSDNLLNLIQDINSLPKAVMVTPNIRQNIPDLVFGYTEDSYYDVYPFRDKHGHEGIYFSDCPSFNKEDQFNWKIGKSIPCSAAFGGFSLIRSSAFNEVYWTADVKCDHVNLCYDLHKYGIIYCNPRNKVYTNVDLSKIDLNACSQIAQQQKDIYEKYF
jgi:GT2 family glycosyltransferase